MPGRGKLRPLIEAGQVVSFPSIHFLWKTFIDRYRYFVHSNHTERRPRGHATHPRRPILVESCAHPATAMFGVLARSFANSIDPIDLGAGRSME